MKLDLDLNLAKSNLVEKNQHYYGMITLSIERYQWYYVYYQEIGGKCHCHVSRSKEPLRFCFSNRSRDGGSDKCARIRAVKRRRGSTRRRGGEAQGEEVKPQEREWGRKRESRNGIWKDREGNSKRDKNEDNGGVTSKFSVYVWFQRQIKIRDSANLN